MTRWTLAVLAAGGLAAGASVADPVADARQALRRDDPTAARELLTPFVKDHPDRADAQELLGTACLRLRDNAGAAAAFTALVKLDPKSVAGHDRLGDAYLKLGRFADAVAEFDKVLELKPESAPEHWRRGIALYYAGRYKDGAAQFETHKTANPEDVENAAWHYLCNARVVGRPKARAELIAVTRDARVPMAEIQKLFAGATTPADVLAAAEAVPAGTDRGTEARFYGNLYVGLWYDAEGDAAKAKPHLTAAVERYKIGHYMWDVAAAHVGALKK